MNAKENSATLINSDARVFLFSVSIKLNASLLDIFHSKFIKIKTKQNISCYMLEEAWFENYVGLAMELEVFDD